MDGVFVTSCGAEIMELSHLNGRELKRSLVVQSLRTIYRTE
jgi:hypothetical protein